MTFSKVIICDFEFLTFDKLDVVKPPQLVISSASGGPLETLVTIVYTLGLTGANRCSYLTRYIGSYFVVRVNDENI